jgi:hypothetical protein
VRINYRRISFNSLFICSLYQYIQQMLCRDEKRKGRKLVNYRIESCRRVLVPDRWRDFCGTSAVIRIRVNVMQLQAYCQHYLVGQWWQPDEECPVDGITTHLL